MFELRRLRLLHELAQRGTLAAVAAALDYSPSTVSQQLDRLQREAGVPLLEADGRRVALTAEGRTLAAHAARMLELDERARADLERAAAREESVRVGSIHTAVHPLVSRALTTLESAQPAVRVSVAVVNPEVGLFELAARAFDLVIAEQYPGLTRAHHPDLDRDPVALDPLRLAVRPGAAAQRLEDVRDEPWVLEPEGTAARRWVTQQCRAAGFEPQVRFEVADPQIHMQLIADGHAVGVLPDLVWDQQSLAVRLVDLPGHPHREIFTATRRSARDRAALQSVRAALADAHTTLADAHTALHPGSRRIGAPVPPSPGPTVPFPPSHGGI